MNEEIKKIYNVVFDIIETRLIKQDLIVPFIVTSDAKNIDIVMYEQTDNTTELIDTMKKETLANIEAGLINAFCLCYSVEIIDPRTNQGTDAVLCEFFQSDEEMKIYIPYNFSDPDIIKKPFQV
jgi:hypothetical protein